MHRQAAGSALGIDDASHHHAIELTRGRCGRDRLAFFVFRCSLGGRIGQLHHATIARHKDFLANQREPTRRKAEFGPAPSRDKHRQSHLGNIELDHRVVLEHRKQLVAANHDVDDGTSGSARGEFDIADERAALRIEQHDSVGERLIPDAFNDLQRSVRAAKRTGHPHGARNLGKRLIGLVIDGRSCGRGLASRAEEERGRSCGEKGENEPLTEGRHGR